MRDFDQQLDQLRLPVWMDKGEPARLLRACHAFWRQVYGALTWPLRQLDATTCAESLLNVLAWQRDISRFDGEPLALFRLRVRYAFVNARDAGSVAGFIAIFARLGIGYVEILERLDGLDWDVVRVRLSDGQLAGHPDLLRQIIRQYGRTCRRYQFEVINGTDLHLRAGWVGGDYQCYNAMLPPSREKS